MEIRRDAYLNELIIRMHNGMIKSDEFSVLPLSD